MKVDWYVIAAICIYFLILITIGLVTYKRDEDMEGYALGGRALGPWVTSMSAETSDMSGWMLMGLPGYAYVAGISAFWIAIGLIIGTWANWLITARRLRVFTQVMKNSITLPEYFDNRFCDSSKKLRIASAVFIFIFFLIYTSSSFVAGGKLFNTAFGLDYHKSLFLTAGIVVFYTLMGGFSAVCWTDLFQGFLMFFSILIVPVTAMYYIGGVGATISRLEAISPNYFSMIFGADGSVMTFTAIISLLGWGFGYFGQPHILVRFMAIKSSKSIKQATHIAVTWVIISLAMAVLVGLTGRVVLGDVLKGSASETVFIKMSGLFFHPLLAGIITSGILGAIMSTSDSQLLVAASSFTTDFYKTLIRKDASPKELVRVSRIMIIVVSGLSLLLALDPDSLILSIVSYAWAGFGAAFGPLVLLSLYWRRMTTNGALAGIIVGGTTVLIWKNFLSFTGIYEIIPGFFLSLAAIAIVSLMDKQPDKMILEGYDKAVEAYKNDIA
ncbi:MAG: sodium/proline symporter PutP [Acidaminococcus sp.]|jgi:sodium/proline symporter|nr:sodium/proline symporter PutP [Acidaminococcus sp.]MCI2100599.1 sodium/proline symporter PutP [Acidaminococcus sp.]MCI2114920.1 sodium/proline symporter PutP [Acidaminococcus sp.]MCI2116946.1 sodium/proline symporter PutP [Acidaminococcus sp.]